MRRGFKSQCERHAVEIRKQMGLGAVDPLPARTLAERKGVAVWMANEVEGLSAEDLETLTVSGRDEWSGFTIRLGGRSLIVVNPSQSPRRQNSVIAHELAHIYLGHDLPEAVITDAGHLVPTVYDREQEDEATWFGATLLLPRPALLDMRRRGLPDDDAATRYGVSLELLRWRVRMTGIDYQLGIRGPPGRRSA
jgi:Zn-dependent peptidase ImmA (M78 family)